MNFLGDVLSPISDIVGIIGLFLSILTYKNTKKIKSSDDRVSFRMEKDAVLSEFKKNLDTIEKYINDKTELAPCLEAMENTLTSIDRLSQYYIWDAEAKKNFSAFSRYKMQIKQIKALNQPYTSRNLTDITQVTIKFISHLENIMSTVEKQM